VLSALVHPWFYALLGYELTEGGLLARPGLVLGWPFWLMAWFDLLIGYLASMAEPADAALLAADLGGGLPRAVAIHDGALQVGEDRARPRHQLGRSVPLIGSWSG
jgi:hypothetical protein